jgi:hypothetical protein
VRREWCYRSDLVGKTKLLTTLVFVHVPLTCCFLCINLGAAIAYGLYHQFRDDAGINDNIGFGVYLLFIGVAMAITVRATAGISSSALHCFGMLTVGVRVW